MKSFVMMLSFFTRIPVRTADGIDETAYKKGIKYLPVIALMLGVAAGAVSMLSMWIDPYVTAFLNLLAYLLLTGALHLDGLADTMDAFGANRDRERTLAIMKDTHIGTFGAVALCVLIAGNIIGLAGAGRATWLFPLAGRGAALLVARVFPCARPGGLGQWFIDGVKWTHVIFAVLLYGAAAFAVSIDYGQMIWMAAVFAPMLGAFALATSLTLLIVSRFSRRIGGVTGDIVGFSVEASQLIYLLAATVLHDALK